MIIAIRGTSGSGKSTLTRRILKHYPFGQPAWKERRKMPYFYNLKNVDVSTNEQIGRGLRVLGHYETPAGGCDTLPDIDTMYQIIQDGHDAGLDVLAEGLVFSSDAIRLIAMHDAGLPVAAIMLNTPLDVCIESVKIRRADAGNDKELNTKATVDKHRAVELMGPRFIKAGVPTFILDRDAAYIKACELLGLEPTDV